MSEELFPRLRDAIETGVREALTAWLTDFTPKALLTIGIVAAIAGFIGGRMGSKAV